MQLAKFDLLTQSACDAKREQYLKCRKKWARFAAFLKQSPWIEIHTCGWGDILPDYLVLGCKVFGLQASTLAKRFYDIMFINVVEWREDISLRAHRVKSLIKAAKLRGEGVGGGGRCKKAPFNTDLLRWIYRELDSDRQHTENVWMPLLWDGLLFAFPYVSEFQNFWI